MKKISRWIGLAAAAALLSACAHNIVVKQDGLSFQDRQDGIAMNAGLSLDEATRNYVYTERRLGETYSFNLGAALESGAQASLLKVFPNLKMSPDGSGVERLVKLKFGPATSFQLGATTLS
ncbi:MAG: hypothetical protein KGK30_01610, partial [Elusimicrobia bacterium]|nr:hypothetical protein [Elusimicrobiota bacterium]